MNKMIQKMLCIGIISLGLQAPLFAGALPISPGKGFTQLATKVIITEKYYDPDGNVLSIPKTSDFTNSFYGEIGIYKKLAVTINLPFYKHFVVNERVRVNEATNMYSKAANTGIIVKGMGDSQLGLKFAVLDKSKIKMGGEVSVAFPTSEFQSGEIVDKYELPSAQGSGRSGDAMEFQTAIPLGSDDYRVGVQFMLDYKPFSVPFETSVQLGFTNRNRGPGTQGYSDVITGVFKVAYPWSRYYFILSAFGEIPLKNGPKEKDVQYLAFGPQVYANIYGPMGAMLGIESAALNKNTLSALAFKGGLTLAW